jgi:hypothetical protein
MTNLFVLANLIRGLLSFVGNSAYNKERGWHELIRVILIMSRQLFRCEDCSSL